jgi:LPXTG-site transpeptidase (sortase) family protein
MRFKLLVKLKKINKVLFLKTVILVLELAALGIAIYLVVLPFYPTVKYKVVYERGDVAREAQDMNKVKEKVAEIKNHLPPIEYAISSNRLIITKIGVNAPIVESKSAEYGLSKGAWHMPDSSTPDKGGNTIITGHRFKYLPPSNLTLYLLDKLTKGDLITVIWRGRDYIYRVREIKIVPKTDFSILKSSEKPILTIFTCHPIYSTEKRLVVISDLVESNNLTK